MVFVELPLSSLDLFGHMAEMRIWLDSNRVDTAGFSYRQHIDRARAWVAFKVRVEAEAFAGHFAGRVIWDTASPGVQFAPPSPEALPSIAATPEQLPPR